MKDSPDFNGYIADMLWSQEYALANREQMMSEALRTFFAFVATGQEVERINCHHNFTQRERHGDDWLWITRKGAIKADNSCAHGAGRRLSRPAAPKQLHADDLARAMAGKTWLRDNTAELIDAAYKNIDQVIDDQKDLVEVEAVLPPGLQLQGRRRAAEAAVWPVGSTTQA